MLLLLGQLIYTSFSKVGFQALTSAAIPAEIRQAFINDIVYQYWDSYNPPSSDYCAVYLHRVSANHTLFGWIYNDGVDDLGRSHVPYFVCYYFAGLLQPVHLNVIFTCLSTGPTALSDRRCLPDRLESIVISEHHRYQPARPGVALALPLQEQSRMALQQEKLFKLFVPQEKGAESLPGSIELIDAPPVLEELTSPEVLSTLAGGTARLNSAVTDASEPFVLNHSLEPANVETYQQLLQAKLDADPVQRPALELQWTIRLHRGLTAAIAAMLVMTIVLVTLILSSFYLRRFFRATVNQPTATSAVNQPTAIRAEDLTLDQTLTQHSDSVWSLILSPDGKTLISGSADQTIKVWNVETGEVLNTLFGHTDVVRSLALAPDGKTLISGSGDRTIKIWDLQTNQLIQTLEQESPVWSVAVSPDGQTFVSGSDDGILKIWSLPTGDLVQTISAHQRQIFSGRIFSVAISPDGKIIATASLDQTLKLWNAQTGELIRTLTEHRDAVRALAFSPDGQTLASASWDETLKLWNWQTGELKRTFVGHDSRAVAVAFSSDGRTLISSSVDNTINLWSIQNGKLLRTLSDHQDWVLAIASDYKRLVSGSKDQTIQIWQSR